MQQLPVGLLSGRVSMGAQIGVWARRQMESGSLLGSELARRFYEYEVRNQKRRRTV